MNHFELSKQKHVNDAKHRETHVNESQVVLVFFLIVSDSGASFYIQSHSNANQSKYELHSMLN